MDTSNLVICKKCGWVHFQIDTDHIINWEKTWEEYWPTLDQEGRDAFGLPDGPPTPELYYECFRCSTSYKNMRDVLPTDQVREGSTIQPILRRDQEKI